jgi:hypothetical protein
MIKDTEFDEGYSLVCEGIYKFSKIAKKVEKSGIYNNSSKA